MSCIANRTLFLNIEWKNVKLQGIYNVLGAFHNSVNTMN